MNAVKCLSIVVALAFAFAGAAQGEPVSDWNQVALNATALGAGGNTWYQTRTLAHMHAAIFDAVNAIDRRYKPYVADLKASGASVDAATATAAHTVLIAHVPAQKAALDRALEAALAKIPDGMAKSDGIAVGKQAAEKLLAERANDRAFDTAVFTIPAAGPGVWQQTPQFTTPILYAWRQVQPMAIKDVKSYDIGGPPKLDSEQFAKDYDEVKTLGARNSATRTSEQTVTAIYWTVMTLVPWNRAAQAAVRERGLSPVESARLFALMNIAAHDAQIVGSEQKYRYNFWRPYNAIRYPGGPGGSLKGDPNWEPLINTPGFPDYPSGHCITSGAASGVLLALFPDDKVNVTDTHIPLVGLTRSWTSFSQMAKEVEDARVWGGIHYRTADEHGTRMGRKVAADVVAVTMQRAN